MKIPFINFMKYRLVAAFISGVLIVFSLGTIALGGLNFGLDFTGGTLVEVKFLKEPSLPKIRQVLTEAGFSEVRVQPFGSVFDLVIRLPEADAPKAGDAVLLALESNGFDVVLQRAEYVGAQVGEELREQGGLGMLMALALVMVYVGFRFQLKFSVGAVIALIHDVIVVLGFFCVFKRDFDLTVLAAVLAVIGYSLNDTIVVSDRIRENFRIMRIPGSVEIINRAINQTLTRTLATSFTTLLVLLALLFFGGEMIENFSLALTVGVLVGTYSSIFIVPNVLLLLKITRDDLVIIELEEEGDERP